ncbi:MAG: cyclase family protein [Candidatus Sumerlaeia bacterium]|nr:cyclase family protein [Candidatus Sumerlaeia bacterium]
MTPLSRLHDITPAIAPGFAVWPGDEAPSQQWLCRIDAGATVNLSSLRSTVHLGAHADAPLHYRADGRAMDECPLDAFLGPARVVRVAPEQLGPQRRIPAEALAPHLDAMPPRVLVATGTYAPGTPYSDDFASFSPEAIDLLAARGAVLVGIDTPSVDPLNDAALLSHGRLAAHGLMNLEGLVLEGVPVGDYELIALPLRLVGFDASPVRAVLRELSAP